MLDEIVSGALVECTDGPLGTVERVLVDDWTGRATALLVRHGQADYLLCIPERFVVAYSAWRVQLDDRFDDVEMAAIGTGRVALDRDQITDGGPTEPCPPTEQVLGQVAGSPPGGPATA